MERCVVLNPTEVWIGGGGHAITLSFLLRGFTALLPLPVREGTRKGGAAKPQREVAAKIEKNLKSGTRLGVVSVVAAAQAFCVLLCSLRQYLLRSSSG